jgi:hypothetical protein
MTAQVPGMGNVTVGDKTPSRMLSVGASGAGTEALEWTVRDPSGRLGGGYEFRFVAEAPHSNCWLSAQATLTRRHRLRLRGVHTFEATRSWPLVADDAPGAPAILRLSLDDGEHRELFAGRPERLLLAWHDGPISIDGGGEPDVIVEWLRDAYCLRNVGGADAEVMRASGGVLVAPGETRRVGDGDVVLVPGGSLMIRLEATQSAELTVTQPLTVSVEVDGRQALEVPTASGGHVSVGRESCVIPVDLPEISRRHGVFEKDSDGWFYRHVSDTVETATIEHAGVRTQVAAGDRQRIVDGDVVWLTGRARLRVSVPDSSIPPVEPPA